MGNRVIHRRSFTNGAHSIEFGTSIDIFKVLRVGVHEGLPTIWYETLSNPIYRRKVELVIVKTDEDIPDRAVHVGSTLYAQDIIHVYQIMQEKK